MTTAVYLTCRSKPFERGLKPDAVAASVIEAWRHSEANHRPGIVPSFVQSHVYLPEQRREFFENEVAVADWESAPIATSTVFVTTGPWAWTDRLPGHERPFLEGLIEQVSKHDPYAVVGLAHLLMVGSSEPPPITAHEVDTIEAVLSHDFREGVLVETRLKPVEPWR